MRPAVYLRNVANFPANFWQPPGSRNLQRWRGQREIRLQLITQRKLLGYWMNRWDSIKAYKAVVRYGWDISHMPAQVELDSPAVSTLNLVHKLEGWLWPDPSTSGKSEKKRQRNSWSALIRIRNRVSGTAQKDELVIIIVEGYVLEFSFCVGACSWQAITRERF